MREILIIFAPIIAGRLLIKNLASISRGPGKGLQGDGMEGFFARMSPSTGNFAVPGVKGKSPNDSADHPWHCRCPDESF
jgi:hypothetical protein